MKIHIWSSIVSLTLILLSSKSASADVTYVWPGDSTKCYGIHVLIYPPYTQISYVDRPTISLVEGSGTVSFNTTGVVNTRTYQTIIIYLYTYDKATAHWAVTPEKYVITSHPASVAALLGQNLNKYDTRYIPASEFDSSTCLAKPCVAEKTAKIVECGEAGLNEATWDDQTCSGQCTMKKENGYGPPCETGHCCQ